jgi:hypothetical protein
VFPYPDPMLVSGLDNIGTRKNVSLTGGLLFLAGMALGYPLALVISGSSKVPDVRPRRRISAGAEFLDPGSLGLRRYPGIGKLLTMALIPAEHRLPADTP